MDYRVELIDAAYRLDLSEAHQLDVLARVLRRRFEPRRQLQAFIVQTSDGVAHCRASAAESGELGALFEVPVPARDLDRIQFSAPARQSQSTLVGRAYRAVLAGHGAREFVGLNCPTGTGSSLVLGAVYRDPHAVDPGERRFWDPVAEHLAIGLRLREDVAPQVDAVFRVDRGIATAIELANGARTTTARSALRRAVLQRERVRGGRRASEGELWNALVHGRWTLIDRFEENGRRFVVAVRTPRTAAIRALDVRAHRVIAAVARGASNKAIAIDNGLSEATISRIVRRALATLGLGLAELLALSRTSASEVQLAHTRLALIAMRSEPPRLRELSSAERATVEGAMRGLATSAISRNRAVSPRTIANQLASAYHKLGVRSRRELILALAGYSDDLF